MASIPSAAFINISSGNPPTNIHVLLNADRPQVSAGYGGWEEVERPGRSTVTTWKGAPARRMSVAILFDNFTDGRSLENEIKRLEALALPRPGGQPPTVRVDGEGEVFPWEKRIWVIDAIEWGDAVMNHAGNRTRQAATITFLEFVSDQLLKFKSPAIERRAKNESKKAPPKRTRKK